jgi:hypothetical protein
MADITDKLDDDTRERLMIVLRKEEQAANTYQLSSLSEARFDALDYYDREPYGEETEGASQVVTSEFADTIEAMMPGLMEVYTGGDTNAEFMPGAPGEEQFAQEATDYVPHVLFRQNDGYRILYWFIKDALMYRLSGTTVDQEDVEEKRTFAINGLPQEAIDLLIAQAKENDAELTMELTPDEQPPPPPGMEGMMPAMPATFSGTASGKRTVKKVIIDNVAPEDIRFTPTARSQDGCSYIGYLRRSTASQLIKMGLSEEEVADLRTDRTVSAEDTQRNNSAILTNSDRDSRGDSERKLWLVVAYVKFDLDGDGDSDMLREQPSR